MKTKFLARTAVLVMTILVILSTTACSKNNQNSGDEGSGQVEYVIRLGHSDTEDNLINTSLVDYAEWVNAMMMPQGVEATYAPKIATLGLPFLFTGYEQAWAVTDNAEIAGKLTEELENYNLIQLAFWENGMRQLTNSVREIDSPEDIAGLSFRIPDDDMTAAIMRELGAKATKFAWSKTYDALKQGTFDGQENPVANIYANNIQEVNQYLTISNHKYESKNMVFSLSTWNKLPKDIQDILAEGAVTFGKEHREAVAASESDQLNELKAGGMIVNEDPDVDAFKNATMNVYTQFELQNEWTADLVTAIRETAAQVQ